ncbi:hypothetical protein ACFV98_26800 [Streptomyces violascens]|uniref:hypothetical protein n=1 Tax=Streptomyces violascens TaxID=67381 RepID=UPI00365092C6
MSTVVGNGAGTGGASRLAEGAAHGPSPVIVGLFLLGGLAALWCGVNWAFDVRGIATRRAENIQRRQGLGAGQGMMWAQPWYQRVLGAGMAGAGLVLTVAAFALWHLGG